MLCAECSHPLPAHRSSTTICSKCKTPLATWWDEDSQTFRTNRETLLPASMSLDIKEGLYGGAGINFRRKNTQSIEEKVFNGALIAVEAHFRKMKIGPKSAPEIKRMVAATLDKSLNKADVRERLAKNVDIWQRLRTIFSLAIPHLTRLSYTHTDSPDVPDASVSLILSNFSTIKEDLHYLNNLLVISRNMLAIKESAQEICARVGFDREVRALVVLCVNVTSKGYDGESVAEGERGRLLEITELYKKLLVTCLQHTHNWTMGNDRFKMLFWFEMLFDNDWTQDEPEPPGPDGLEVDLVYREVANWLRRHKRRDPVAEEILKKYEADVPLGDTPGPLPEEDDDSEDGGEESTTPVWKPEIEDKYEQDRLYARVSHSIDVWWKRVRDANYDGWVVPMETVDGAKERAHQCKENAMHRYIPARGDPDHNYENDEHYDDHPQEGNGGELVGDDRSLQDENGNEDEDEDDEEEDEDDSYVEGPLRGLLTEIPNILDTKQIEALHMTVKACIVDSMGSGLTPAGENLQKTRCKMFLALDCGRNLLREMLVFIAVWEQTDQQFIFQITAQIIESFHHNALLPYAWNSLRILKDIVSPAQTVLLRLINYMFRARKDSPIYDDLKDYNRDAKLIHFLYNYFRCRVVPDCVALIYAQAQIRANKQHPSDFPVDLWDMERAKDGLSQYLDFLSVIAEIPEMRHLLIEWDCAYELVSLLRHLESGVARKTLDESSSAASQTPQNNPNIPPLHDTPYKFPWSGIKIQILIILTSLLAPTNPRRTGPGNPIVQKQLLEHGGIMCLLNCCVYDGWNEYLKERATLAIKFAMEGCEEAQQFVRELVPVKQAQAQAEGDPKGAVVEGTSKKEGVASGSGADDVKMALREKGHVIEGDAEADAIIEEARVKAEEAARSDKGKGKERATSS